MKAKTAIFAVFAAFSLAYYVCSARPAPGMPRNLRDAPNSGAAVQLGLGDASPAPSPTRAKPVESAEEIKFYVDGMQVPEPTRARLPCARTPGNVYLACQFPTESTDQRDVGSCHAFAAIALIEAAYYRQYGKNIKFSEADLLVRNTVLQSGYYRGSGIQEGNSLLEDIEFALKTGVSRRILYDWFLEQYYPFREREKKLLKHINSSILTSLLVNPAEVAKFFKEERIQLFLGKYVDRERFVFRDQIKDFRLKNKRYHWSTISGILSDIDPRKCRERGEAQKQLIVSELEAGRPVAISYNVKGMQGFSGNGFHGVVVFGMRSASGPSAGEAGIDDGRAGEGDIFYLRNSGFGGSEFKDTDMCRIMNIVSLIVPADKE